MSNVTAKNYMTDGGDKWVVGGTLEVNESATVTGITVAVVVDNLTTDDATKALSAKQGKALKTLVDTKVATADIVNDLTTGGETVPLSAEQGKTLASRVAANVPLAVGEAPTKAEFDALITALIGAGLMASQ